MVDYGSDSVNSVTITQKMKEEKELITYKKLKVGSMAERLKVHANKFINVLVYVAGSRMFNLLLTVDFKSMNHEF